MNNAEARAVVIGALATYREWSYGQLCEIVDAPKRTFEMVGPSGARYQIDVRAYWDGEPNVNIRVVGTIDDGGWRAFLPLVESFIKAPDGSFVGES